MPTTITVPFSIGRWEVASTDAPAEGPHLNRIELTKVFKGDLAGESRGEGLFCGMNDPAAGAGYVVSERFEGTLAGRTGTFVLQHVGIAAAGEAPRSFGHIVPGSGTGDLQGVRGDLAFEAGHVLTLTYDLD